MECRNGFSRSNYGGFHPGIIGIRQEYMSFFEFLKFWKKYFLGFKISKNKVWAQIRVNSDVRFGFYVKNCVYRHLETSVGPKFDRKTAKKVMG